MRLHKVISLGLLLGFVMAAPRMARPSAKTVTLNGYVLDSACAFTKNLKKPVSPECAIACARAGSPLVILADNGKIYWPISDATPAVGQNARLMRFAGKRVRVTGLIYVKGASQGIVIGKIEPAHGGM